MTFLGRSIGEVPGGTWKRFVRRRPAIQPLLDCQDAGFYWLRLPASVVVRHRISVESHSSRERQRRCRQAENQREHGLLLCTPRLPHRYGSSCSSSFTEAARWCAERLSKKGPASGAGLKVDRVRRLKAPVSPSPQTVRPRRPPKREPRPNNEKGWGSGEPSWILIGTSSGREGLSGGILYRVPEIVTRGRFPDGGESDSTWRTQEARHVGSDTIAPGFPAVHGVVRWR